MRTKRFVKPCSRNRTYHFISLEAISPLDEVHVLLVQRGVSDCLLCLLKQLFRLQLCKFHHLVLWQELHSFCLSLAIKEKLPRLQMLF